MIVCDSVCKSYPLGHGKKQVLGNISLEVRPGQHVGVLGRNGAGKTTLIKLIGGVEMPDSGSITRGMSVSWPLGFGGGFQGSLTGYDNARFIARIYDRDYADIREYMEEFTELGASLRNPVKTYSAGMKARLAFALSLAIEFDCYMIDEVILVGDHDFQRKCYHELFEKRHDRALLLASHSRETILAYCDTALVLNGGKGTMYDDINEAIAVYDQL